MLTELKRMTCVCCGGELAEKDGKLVCKYCKNTYTEVEKISEEEVVALNRATTDRNLRRFDEAMEEYALLLEKYPDNEAGNWGALLCEYGIVYEEDYNGKYIPTCHRLSERPLEKTPYYRKLNAEHKKEAQQIEALRLSIMEKTKSVKPYDVFICYKATEERFGMSLPTKESVWARDVYEMLTHELKLNVFFAEKSLAGSNIEYEPHIYAALNSAKLMFVLTTGLENVNSVWVKNEWKRYSKYIQEGQDKTIRVVYDNIEPYDLPRELQKTQAINHNTMSWGEAVKKAAEAVFSKPEPIIPPKATAPKQTAKVPVEKMAAKDAFNLAWAYERGINGKPQDYAKAIYYYNIAVAQNYAAAQRNLGVLYSHGKGVAQNLAEAARLYRLAADQKDALGQNNLGYCYEKGRGVAQNYAEAVRLYKLSVNQGNALAQCNLGVCYENGRGVAQNYAEAVRLYKLSAEQGNASAQCNLGVCYENGRGVAQNYAEAVRLYKLSANQGNASAQCCLGFMYKTGKGVAQNYAEAVRLYKLSANQGHARAQCNLGVCYENGTGVAQNYAEAVRLYKLSANQGNAQGQTNLGFMYRTGKGVEQNYAEAARLYKLSANQGNANAQCNLGWLYEMGYGVPKNYTESARLYLLAAKQGEITAQNNIGLCYQYGRGVTKNITEAVKWYRLSANQGNQKAKENLQKLGYSY